MVFSEFSHNHAKGHGQNSFTPNSYIYVADGYCICLWPVAGDIRM